ncbi:MAG: urease accessory protein UreD [Hyphomicrobiaceae bacterium]
MSDVISRSEIEARQTAAEALAPVRVTGGVNARFLSDGTRTVVASVAERGGYRMTRPSTFAPHLEALQLNSAGGIAGGDRIETRYELGPGADVVHTTSSGERVYRTAGPPARLELSVLLEPGARLDWLPHQTLVYAGASLDRRIEVQMASDSRLLLVEMLTFGRPESNEGDMAVRINDQWRIRRDGRLVYAEALRFSGVLGDVLTRPAIGGGARASAVLLLVARDAPDQVDPVRRVLESDAWESGVSAWDGLLAARLLAQRPGQLVAALARAIPILSGRALPRVWAT